MFCIMKASNGVLFDFWFTSFTLNFHQLLPKIYPYFNTSTFIMNIVPIRFDRTVSLKLKGATFLVVLLAVTNFLTYSISFVGSFNQADADDSKSKQTPSFYLADQAAKHIQDMPKFESKVRRISRRLQIPPEWLMTVIFFESGFKPDAVNGKGSGATGLLQWRREEAEIIEMSPEKIKNLDAFEQLDLIESYLKKVSKNQGEGFEYLTDLYLAAFYPQALGEDYCYALYQKGEVNYQRYESLDTNNDGRITVKDIDDRLKNQFPSAYMLDKQSAKSWWASFGLF